MSAPDPGVDADAPDREQQPADAAADDGGAHNDESPGLAQLWQTMGAVQAGLHLRRQEAEADLKEVEAQRADAWAQLQEAEKGDRQDAIDTAQRKLAQVDRIYLILVHDLHDPTAQSEDQPDALTTVKDPDR